MPTYDPKAVYAAADKKVLAEIIRACNHFGADTMERRAAVETAIVESDVQAIDHGDRDSVGPFQQRAGWGSKADRIDPYKSALAFLAEARRVRKRFTSSGKLAYAVQRCAFQYRGRYAQARRAAVYLIAMEAAGKHAAPKKRLPLPSLPKLPRLTSLHPRRAAARAWMRKESLHPTRNRKNECQRTVRIALGIGPGAPSAIAAWLEADPAFSHTVKIPEAGTAVYLKGGKFGHAVLVEKPGKDISSTTVWSTDIRRQGCVDLTTIGSIEKRWGYKYLGWTTKMNGVEF